MSDLFVEDAALLLSFVPLTALIVPLHLVDLVELFIHGNVLSNAVVVFSSLHFVLNQLALDRGQLLNMLRFIDLLEGALLFGLVSHLLLQFGPHLFSLYLHAHCFLAHLCVPLGNVLLHGVVPLGRSHTNHFALITLDDLLVAVDVADFRAGAGRHRASRGLRTGLTSSLRDSVVSVGLGLLGGGGRAAAERLHAG